MDANKKEVLIKGRSGNHCDHSAFTKEFVLGAPTGNYVCAKCGRHLSAILRTIRR